MFTGLVETIGVLRRRGGGAVAARALIEASLGPLSLGESISVSGACLTVDRIASGGFECDMSTETLARTTLGALSPGARVHLERATPLGGRMGGHMVLGHVDGIGRVIERKPEGAAVRLSVRAPAEIARFLAAKGSIAIDGVSLTLNEVGAPLGGTLVFQVMLVPHTLSRTLFGELLPGSAVNLEVDVLARYVARQLEVSVLAGAPSSGHGDPERGSTDRTGAGGTEGHMDHDERLLEKLRAGGFR
jgi:riboflavin synthase